MSISLENTPSWLTWGEESVPHLADLFNSYHDTVAKAIGRSFASIKKEDSQNGDELIDSWGHCQDSYHEKIIHSAETSFYVFFFANRAEQNKSYFKRVLAAEHLEDIDPQGSDSLLWSCNGEKTLVNKEYLKIVPSEKRRVIETAYLDGKIPIDFRSPHALAVSLEPTNPQMSIEQLKRLCSDQPISCYTLEEEQQIVRRLEDSYQMIGEVNKNVQDFVRQFTLSLVIRKDEQNPRRFTSGSTGQYVGRTCLINPTAHGVDSAVLADGLVHEAIHSVLYMQERFKPWVTDSDVYFGDGYSSESPWSGRPLTPRQFMQACFVWYGLYMFWSLPQSAAVFGEERSSRMAFDARTGFYKSRLVDHIKDWRCHTDPELVETIDNIQKRVIEGDFPEL